MEVFVCHARRACAPIDGSTLQTTGRGGAAQATYAYRAFGTAYEGSLSDTNPYGFTGKRYDGMVGLHDYGLWSYNPAVGRWMTEDPARAGLNWYAYVNNDPTDFVDPLGLNPSDLANTEALASGLLQGVGSGIAAPVTTAIAIAKNPTAFVDSVESFFNNPVGTVTAGAKAKWDAFVSGGPETKGQILGSLIPDVAFAVATAGTSAIGTSAADTVAAGKGLTVADDLTAAAQRAAQTVGPGKGAVYGTKVHSAFEAEVNALGNGNLGTEVSYLNGQIVPRGTAGSVRLDVVEYSNGAVSQVFDLKTGSATLSPARMQQIQQAVGSNVPVSEIRP